MAAQVLPGTWREPWQDSVDGFFVESPLIPSRGAQDSEVRPLLPYGEFGEHRDFADLDVRFELGLHRALPMSNNGVVSASALSSSDGQPSAKYFR